MTRLNRMLNYRSASIVLFGVLLVLLLLNFRSYGIAWDEPLRLSYGRYLISQFNGKPADPEDIKAVETTNLYLYGGAFDIFATSTSNLLARHTTLGEVERWHLLNGLVGLLGLLGCWVAARWLAGDAAAFWAALLLVSIPGYSGQMFINPKDIPLAVGYIWSLAFLIALIKGLPRLRIGALTGFALSSGLAMGVRAGGIFLLAYLLLVLLLNYVLTLSDNSGPAPAIWGAESPPSVPGYSSATICSDLPGRLCHYVGILALGCSGSFTAHFPGPGRSKQVRLGKHNFVSRPVHLPRAPSLELYF